LKSKNHGKTQNIGHGLMATKKNAMNNIVILDHHGVFIYIDSNYLGSYHNVSILRHLVIYRKQCQYFIHRDDYFEYLLGDPRYLGEEMFIMRRMGRSKLPPNVDYGVVHAWFKAKCL
jgi:hypothetical protein